MTGKSPSSASPPRRWPRFSVASGLLVTALVAVVLAAARSAVQAGPGVSAADPDKEWIVFAGILGMFFGALAGAEIGASHPRWVRGTALGLVVGMASGAVAGVMAAMPRCLLVVLVGAPILVAFAAAVRYLSRDPERSRETGEEQNGESSSKDPAE